MYFGLCVSYLSLHRVVALIELNSVIYRFGDISFKVNVNPMKLDICPVYSGFVLLLLFTHEWFHEH